MGVRRTEGLGVAGPTHAPCAHSRPPRARQVLIRWAAQRGTSVLPKSVNPARIRSNLDVAGWELPPEDFAALSALPTQARAFLHAWRFAFEFDLTFLRARLAASAYAPLPQRLCQRTNLTPRWHPPLQMRMVPGDFWVSVDGPYKTLEDLWDGP